MDSFPSQAPFWRYKTDMTRAEKDEFERHRELAFRLAFWWEENAYFADIWPHWHERFAFGEFDPIRNEWITMHHGKVIYHATARDGSVVPIRERFMPKTVAESITGAALVRTSALSGKRRSAYAFAPPVAYPNWKSEAVRFLHIDIDYPYLKKLWKAQDRPAELRVDAQRKIEWDELIARDADRQRLQAMGALVVGSNTGLHAHFYLLDPITPAEGRDLIVALNAQLVGHVEQTNLGEFGHWDRRQTHLPLPILRRRKEREFMRVPQMLLDFFVEPDDWSKWKPVQVEADELWARIGQGAAIGGSGLQPSPPPAQAKGLGANARVGDIVATPQQRLLNRIKVIFEPYLVAMCDAAGSSPSIVDGHSPLNGPSPVVPDIEDGDSQAWFRAGHIHRFETWADAEQYIHEQSAHLDRGTVQDRLAVAQWMWHKGSGRFSDGLDAALTPVLLSRVAHEVTSRIEPSGNLVKGRLKSKRLRIGVGIISSLLDARKKKGHRFFKTFGDLAMAYGEPDASNFGKRTLGPFFEPFFQKVDDGNVKVLLDQEWPTNIYEPTDLGHELLALSPPHPSPTMLDYKPVQPKLPLHRRSRAAEKAGRARALPWQAVRNAATVSAGVG